jgi:hypothetical protein
VGSVDDLGLPPALTQTLRDDGLTTAEVIAKRNPRELQLLWRVGPGAVGRIAQALDGEGLKLAVDPLAPYVCARHGSERSNTSLCTFLLCRECCRTWSKEAFDGTPPAFKGESIKSACMNCGRSRQVAFHQWFLCENCERIARSIPRSLAAEELIRKGWEAFAGERVEELELSGTDEPWLQFYGEGAKREPMPDFRAVDRKSGEPLFALELKTGKSRIGQGIGVGTGMGAFQLDISDCDDIRAVMSRERIPVYLIHAQVIDRYDPPARFYVGTCAWWANPFDMRTHWEDTRQRSRETRDAAYFKLAMFSSWEDFEAHVDAGKPDALRERIRKSGPPRLYR